MKTVVLATILLLPTVTLGQVTVRIHQHGQIIDEYTVTGDDDVYIERDDEGRYNILGGQPEPAAIAASAGRPDDASTGTTGDQRDELFSPHTWYDTTYSSTLLTTTHE